MKSRVVCTDDFDPTQKKTGVNVKAALLSSLSKFGIDSSHLRRAIFTTDKGSNIVVALKSEERLDCVNHVLNRVVQQALEEKHCPDDILALVATVKSAVGYVKKSSIHSLLNKSVKQAICYNPGLP